MEQCWSQNVYEWWSMCLCVGVSVAIHSTTITESASSPCLHWTRSDVMVFWCRGSMSSARPNGMSFTPLHLIKCRLLYRYSKYAIMHVICTNNHCWLVQRSTLPVNITSRTSSHAFAADFWSEHYIRHIKLHILHCVMLSVSCDVTVVSSFKGL